jgi:hypothetical protein
MCRKKKDDFSYNRFLKPICEAFTDHKNCRLIAWDSSFGEGGYKYANRHDFYYKCNICGYVFFNHRVSPEDLEYIKKFEATERLDRLNIKGK